MERMIIQIDTTGPAFEADPGREVGRILQCLAKEFQRCDINTLRDSDLDGYDGVSVQID
ncbi:MAG: hypothetical protein V2A79_10150 [Planctomycetota bacterium]